MSRFLPRLRGARPLFVLAVICLVVGTASGQPGQLQPANTVEPTAPDNTALLGMTLAEINEEIQRRAEDLQRYESRLDELTRENETLRQELEGRAAELQARESRMRARIVTLCRLSRGGFVQILRGAQNWTDLLRRAQMTRSVIDRDVGSLRDHQQQVEELESQKQGFDERMASQRQLRERIIQYQQELEQEAERRRRVMRRARRAARRSLPADEFGDEGWEGGLSPAF